MIDKILTVVKLLIAILPFLLLCLANRKNNLDKVDRSKQYWMPVISLVYVIVAMLLVNNVCEWILEFIRNIPAWFKNWSNESWMPDSISALLLKLSRFVKQLIRRLNLNFWVFFIANTLIILVYIIVKKICISILNRSVKLDGEIHAKVAGIFYEYFPEKSKWCIKEEYVQVRGMFKLFYFSAVILSCLLMIVSRYFYFEELMSAVFYPVFGIIFVGELFFFLDGSTRREYSQDILGEDEEAYKTVNYSLLRRFLRSVFGDKLLAENTGINNALEYGMTTDEILRELEQSEDQKVVAFATYFSALNKTGFTLDHNYIRSSLDMLNGKSILFNNPFYNDLIPYAFYPMNRTLLQHKKVLVVLGRHSVEDDIKGWIEKGIESITNIPFMWNIGVLDSSAQDLDIGIVTRSDVLNIELHNANSEFLENVGFFVVIEPSKLLSSAQIGLNLLVKKCNYDETVYCVCDKNCDGLVDALSHVLMTSITEVSATKKHLGTSSYMCWGADDEYLHHRLFPNVSRYLGVGTELSFAALKNQVSKTYWYGGETFPVTDISWISKQYYYDLTKYASLATAQGSVDESFVTSPNLWSAEPQKHSYITVEDESYNMFEILRDFSTRTSEQGFINIISSDYLLRDYMADNASIFEADAKAVPYIVADYTRSGRNTLLRILLMLSTFPVCEDTLCKEFSLLGISVFDLKKQLWYELSNCFGDAFVRASNDEYKLAVKDADSYSLKLGNRDWSFDLIKESARFNVKLGKMETVYYIDDPDFLKVCVADLRSAGYIAEDEKGQQYYLGSELCGHIYQKYLPSQFFTFGGKYYEMQYLTADGQVLVRRAADHITGRPSYRQIRNYTIKGLKASDKIGACKNIQGLRIVKMFADICVDTSGYYNMQGYNDFAKAKKVQFEGENNGIPQRVYRNKEILCVELPDFGGKLNNNIRYTITVLFNEIFRTLFAENQAYICALTDDSFIEQNEINPLTYSITGEGCELNSNAIYIVEDSQLDLGLTVAVERNLQRIFNIIYDYLDWHMETLDKSLNPPEDPQPAVEFDYEDSSEKKRKGFFGKIGRGIKKVFGKIKGWFKRKPKKEEPADAPEEAPEEAPVNTPVDAVDDTANVIVEDAPDATNVQEPEVPAEPTPQDSAVEDKDAATAADNTVAGSVIPVKAPYHERYYMLYGAETEPSCIDVVGAFEYLAQMGTINNPLKQARDGKNIAKLIEETYIPDRPDSRYCDFCGTEILGVEYETLADGRDRCLACSRTAIKTGEEFRKIFEDVKRNMESFFGIKINVGIKVEMVNSKTLHRRLGKAFVPTPKADGRVLGVAISDRHGYSLLVENGSPRMASMLTMAHELTHIWQYINWDDKAIRKKYGKNMRLEIYEGMAKWVEVQYAYLINEPATAKREEIITAHRDDEYGHGFLRYCANYPFSYGTVITKATPFMNVDTPLGLEYCGSFTVRMPTDGINAEDVEAVRNK